MANKKTKNLPPEKDWRLYLERKIPLFTAAAFTEPYGAMLLRATGFQFVNRLFVYKKDLCAWYHSAREMKKADNYYLNLMNKKHKALEEWAKLGKLHNKNSDKLIGRFKKNIGSAEINRDYKKIFEQCQDIMLYGTVIPYRILSAIDSVSVKGVAPKAFRRYYNLFEPLRAETRYPQISTSIFSRFWRAAAKSINANDNSLFSYATPQEVYKIITRSEKLNLSDLKKRRRWCMFWSDKENSIHFNYNASYLEKIGITKFLHQKMNELKGSIAYKGLARGRVRIINNIKEVKGFRRGDIIVSINTNPSLMPAIVKCGGIITDEGGIMCHAAIAARELKKPCIIGTKVATKVLSDGDVVELNANNGIVNILKRCNLIE